MTPIKITSKMTERELLALKPRGATRVVLRVEGEHYPEKERPVSDLPYFVGINGEIVFKS